MRTLKSILLAADFRPASDDALNAAAQLATMFSSHVSVLHVVEPAGAAAQLYGLQKLALLAQCHGPTLNADACGCSGWLLE
jgi:nucleotide-binding universal stress UspA family protein